MVSVSNLLIMRNGAAKLMPINSMPKYMAMPNAANVAIIADRFPSSPSHGFDRTTSPIMHVIILFRAIWGLNYFIIIISMIFCVNWFFIAELRNTNQWKKKKKYNGHHSCF